MAEPTASPTNNPDQPDDFDPTNRAWQRLEIAAAEHLDIITWQCEDGRPVLLSLVDLRSRDVVTLAVIDSLQMRDPHALLVLTANPATAEPVLNAYGPFDGATTADNFAPQQALEDPNNLGGRTVPLVHPDQPTVPDTAWMSMPAGLAATVGVDPAPGDASPVAVLLLDRVGERHALVGPFPHQLSALAWVPDPAPAAGLEWHVLALHPAPPADSLAWLRP
jgi:hypothetical protein